MSKPLILGDNVKIGKDVQFGENVIIYSNVEIEDGTIISHNCIIGDTDLKYFKKTKYNSLKTKIGANCFIRPFSLISEGVTIGKNTQIGDKVLIRKKTIIGNNCSIGSLCDIQGDLQIGNNVRIHSNVHIGMKTIIEDHVWIYPFVIITNDPAPPTGELLSCRVEKYSQIASGTILMPGVTIGNSSFVGCGSVISKDVEKEQVYYGSPAKKICKVSELKNLSGKSYLPWQNFKE